MFRTALAPLAAALALTAAPAAAQTAAATPAAGYFTSGKTHAILGGESRLAAIMAQQSGQALPQPAAYRPGYGAPLVQARVPVYRPAIAMDRPDIFNSVALPIGQTSLNRRWRRVASGAVRANSAAYASGLIELSPIEQLQAVNRYVNARVTFVDDSKQYGIDDHWTSAADTLRRGRGDCEDYAIAKLQLLHRAGFAEHDLYLVILRDSLRRADHAVLVARAEGRLLVLDNGTDRLIDSYEMPDYRPIVTFSGDRTWTHGYRRETPPVFYAANGVAAPVTFAAASVAALSPGAPAN